MNIVWKGIFKDESQLERGELPEGAVPFKEPDSLAKLNLVAVLFTIPVFIFVGILIYLKKQLGLYVNTSDIFSWTGLFLAVLAIIPHEIIHALLFPKDAEVNIWFSLKNMIPFVYSVYPVSKKRFIWLSLMPSIIFGVLPLVIWFFMPGNKISDFLLSFGSFSLLMGAGDYLNVFNAITQMPEDAVTQLSGLHSYWYIKDDINEN